MDGRSSGQRREEIGKTSMMSQISMDRTRGSKGSSRGSNERLKPGSWYHSAVAFFAARPRACILQHPKTAALTSFSEATRGADKVFLLFAAGDEMASYKFIKELCVLVRHLNQINHKVTVIHFNGQYNSRNWIKTQKDLPWLAVNFETMSSLDGPTSWLPSINPVLGIYENDGVPVTAAGRQLVEMDPQGVHYPWRRGDLVLLQKSGEISDVECAKSLRMRRYELKKKVDELNRLRTHERCLELRADSGRATDHHCQLGQTGDAVGCGDRYVPRHWSHLSGERAREFCQQCRLHQFWRVPSNWLLRLYRLLMGFGEQCTTCASARSYRMGQRRRNQPRRKVGILGIEGCYHSSY